VLATDGNGYCGLPADDSLKEVIAMDRARTLLGWATVDSLRREPVLRLLQLHRLELFPTQASAALLPKGYDVKLSSSVLEQLTGDSDPLWSGCDAEGKCVFVGLPAGSYQATLLPRKKGDKQGAGRVFAINLAADAPALVRYELPVEEKQVR
jgi:hypothetical protein